MMRVLPGFSTHFAANSAGVRWCRLRCSRRAVAMDRGIKRALYVRPSLLLARRPLAQNSLHQPEVG